MKRNGKVIAESARLQEAKEQHVPWRRWGPYLSERQWGTVREDYSQHGNAWEYFSHDQARSRAYRWGEDGIAGISDDPILKERLFGLTGNEGNHGEDVKEYYYYLDNLPSHSYMKMLYKYPHQAYPYERIVTENAHRGKQDFEFELISTEPHNLTWGDADGKALYIAAMTSIYRVRFNVEGIRP